MAPSQLYSINRKLITSPKAYTNTRLQKKCKLLQNNANKFQNKVNYCKILRKNAHGELGAAGWDSAARACSGSWGLEVLKNMRTKNWGLEVWNFAAEAWRVSWGLEVFNMRTKNWGLEVWNFAAGACSGSWELEVVVATKGRAPLGALKNRL